MRAIPNLTPIGGYPITVSSLAAGAISAKSPRTPVPKPQSHHRTGTDLELPEWLPPPVASYARQINCQTKSDELMLRRLTSDPRMKVVWTELLKRKRSGYKSSDTFKYPAAARMDRDSNPRELLRRAHAIRQMSGPHNEGEAKKLELIAATWRSRTRRIPKVAGRSMAGATPANPWPIERGPAMFRGSDALAMDDHQRALAMIAPRLDAPPRKAWKRGDQN